MAGSYWNLRRRQYFRHHPDSDADRNRFAVLERPRHCRGWILTAGGALFFILAGVIANLHIYFQPTSLFHTIVMLILKVVGGLVLIARSLLPH